MINPFCLYRSAETLFARARIPHGSNGQNQLFRKRVRIVSRSGRVKEDRRFPAAPGKMGRRPRGYKSFLREACIDRRKL